MQGGSDLKAGRTSSSSASSSSSSSSSASSSNSSSSGSSTSRTSSSSGAANSAKSAKNLHSLLHFCIIASLQDIAQEQFFSYRYGNFIFHIIIVVRSMMWPIWGYLCKLSWGLKKNTCPCRGDQGQGGVRDFTNPILLNKPIFISTSPGICKLWNFRNLKITFAFKCFVGSSLNSLTQQLILTWQSMSENEQSLSPFPSPQKGKRKRARRSLMAIDTGRGESFFIWEVLLDPAIEQKARSRSSLEESDPPQDSPRMPPSPVLLWQ